MCLNGLSLKSVKIAVFLQKIAVFFPNFLYILTDFQGFGHFWIYPILVQESDSSLGIGCLFTNRMLVQQSDACLVVGCLFSSRMLAQQSDACLVVGCYVQVVTFVPCSRQDEYGKPCLHRTLNPILIRIQSGFNPESIQIQEKITILNMNLSGCCNGYRTIGNAH